MEIKVNGEFLKRHLFAALVVGGMGLWFGYDGYVRYPSMTPAELYADAHKGAAAPDDAAARKFYGDAIPRQRQFMALCLIAAAIIGVHLFAVARQRLVFDEAGFTWRGKRYFYGEIKQVNRKAWKKKGILKITLDAGVLTLDAWHHKGVDDFEKMIGTVGSGGKS